MVGRDATRHRGPVDGASWHPPIIFTQHAACSKSLGNSCRRPCPGAVRLPERKDDAQVTVRIWHWWRLPMLTPRRTGKRRWATALEISWLIVDISTTLKLIRKTAATDIGRHSSNHTSRPFLHLNRPRTTRQTREDDSEFDSDASLFLP